MRALGNSLGELHPLRPLTGRRTVRRYEIRTAKRATPGDVERLRRAYGRMLSRGEDDVRMVEVSTMRGCFHVDMEVAGSPRHVRRVGERLFADAWYDAFGPRSNTHIGILDEETAPPALLAV